jgi:(R,R)-butanediol dehydrogenase/meso-butanediol dehydrogenase/diacetyl reductase/L-iditol 2-dehydrogenase
MKQIQVIKPGNLFDPNPDKRGKVRTVEVPEYEMGSEHVKIKVAYCSICGSDPHLVENAFGYEPPYGLGHEVSGVIIDMGNKVNKKGLKIGDRVAGNFLSFCGVCYYCLNGQQQFCEFRNATNRAGMSEYITWHESQVEKLPDSVDLKTGCLLEPISVAVRLVDKITPRIGQRVAISGGGPIGLLALQLLRMFGSSTVTLIEPIEERRNLALTYGADYVINPKDEDIFEKSMDITDGKGFDIIAECSGNPSAVGILPSVTAKGGTLLYTAMYPTQFEMPINLFKYFYFNEINVSGFFLSPYTFPRSIQIMPRLNLKEFTKKVFYIDDSAEAFEAQISGKYLKILIQCNKEI